MTKRHHINFLIYFFLGSFFSANFFASPTHANLGDTYGFGSRTAALGGATAAWGYEAFAAYTNPAGLAYRDGKKLKLSFGLLYMRPSFSPISGVVIENKYSSDRFNDVRSGTVDTDYRSTFGEVIGINLKMVPKWWNLSFGFTVFTPLNQLAHLDTGDSFAPEYVLYRSRTQKPHISLGFGANPMEMLYFGVGMNMGFSVTTKANAFIATSKTKSSTARFASTIKPKAAPYAGILVGPKSKAWSAASVLRLPVTYNNVLEMQTGAELLAGVSAPDINISSTSALNYDPLTVELSFSTKLTDRLRIFAQVDYQNWRAYESPSIFVKNEGGGISVAEGQKPVFATQEIFIPRAGCEFLVQATSLRAGYAFRPSIFKAVPNGAGNLLDPPKHLINAGAGWKFTGMLGWKTEWNLDFHASYHLLVKQHIEKEPGNEIGAAKDSKIGAPSYDAGGKIWGGGTSISFLF